MSEVTLTENAKRRLDALDKNVRETVKIKIDMLANHPNMGYPLKGDLAGFYKFYVRKKYRVVYCIEDDGITVTDIGHRSTIYHKKT